MKSDGIGYQGPAFFSYGFRPFFLSAALFAAVAVPVWILMFAGVSDRDFLYPARDWHVHEMIFGFLPAVITGFLLTAIPNWTDRLPIRGPILVALWVLWLAGRLLIVNPWFSPLVSAVVDSTFLVTVAGLVWRELTAAKSWFHAPMAVLVSLYAGTNILFHVLALNGAVTDLPERMALAVVMVLLAMVGGRVTPNFTIEYMAQQGLLKSPAPFSHFDSLALALVAIAAVMWVIQPQALVTGWVLLAAGLINLRRMSRWYGWLTWQEPLVLILHIGYAWLVLALLLLGSSILGLGLSAADAVHTLSTGAVGVMTLAVMTRASLGHTGRSRHAGPLTVCIYGSVMSGALLRVFGSAIGLPENVVFGASSAFWSGGYLLFALSYGPFLLRPSLEE